MTLPTDEGVEHTEYPPEKNARVRCESSYQSYAMKAAACQDEFTDPYGTVRTPEFIDDREFEVQRLINGVSQHIARVERAWHKALDVLQRLQDRRRKEATHQPTPAGEPAKSAAAPSPKESAAREEPPPAAKRARIGA